MSSRAGTVESQVTESAYNTCHTLGSFHGENLFSPPTESSATEKEWRWCQNCNYLSGRFTKPLMKIIWCFLRHLGDLPWINVLHATLPKILTRTALNKHPLSCVHSFEQKYTFCSQSGWICNWRFALLTWILCHIQSVLTLWSLLNMGPFFVKVEIQLTGWWCVELRSY